MAETTPTLVIGEGYSRCSACGAGADGTREREHRTAYRPLTWTEAGPGCGIRWEQTAVDPYASEAAYARIREVIARSGETGSPHVDPLYTLDRFTGWWVRG